MRKLLLILFLFFDFLRSYSQGEMTLSFMDNVMQSSYINPANIPQHSFSIGLPGVSSVYAGVTNTGFNYRNVVTKTGDSNLVNLYGAVDALKKSNYFYTGTSIDLFSVRFKVRHYYFSFNITDKADIRLSYPQDLMKMLAYGDAIFAGGQANMNSFGLDAAYYREYAVGITREMKNWTWGGRAKFLSGYSDVNLKADNFGVNVGTKEQDYAISAASSLTLNMSGIPITTNSNGFGNQLPYNSPYGTISPSGNYSFSSSNLFNTSNPGFALDGGASYKYNKKLSFNFSFNNIGFINWKQNVENHTINSNQAFQGFDVAGQFLRGDTIRASALGDSVKNNFSYKKTNNSYTTWLVPQFYLGAKYQLARRTQLGILARFEVYHALRVSSTLAVTQKIGRIFSIVGTYTAQYGQYNNLGIGFTIKPGPVQFYMVSDNLTAVFDPLTAKTFNVRAGINLVFERTRRPDKQPHPEN